MIPKIIHYCWLSNDPYPSNIKECIDSWHRILPDYKIWLWNFKRFDINQSIWVKEAYEKKKYAFAADYIRLYALYHFGGIYLDSDVEVLKSFNPLLYLPYFIGQEKTPYGIEAATIGCEKGHHLFKDMLMRYENRHFIHANGYLETTPLPLIFRACIESRYNYSLINNIDEFVNDTRTINVLPCDWFSPKAWDTHIIETTPNTFSIHHFSASWKKGEESPILLTRKPSLRTKVMHRKRRIAAHIKRVIIHNKFLSWIFFSIYTKDYFDFKNGIRLYKEDYPLLKELSVPIADIDLYFINQKKAKHKSKEFYPVARPNNTEIEIHFTSTFTKKDAINLWKTI